MTTDAPLDGWPARMARLVTPRVAVVVLVIFATVPFLPALTGGFVFDDEIGILKNQAVISDLSLINIIDSGFWGGKEAVNSGSYRPLAVLTFAIDWRLGGEQAWFFHLTNILLHALCVLVIYIVLRRRWTHGAATACSLLFAVHALHTENVAGIVGRADVLATIFGMLAWHVAGGRTLRAAAGAGALLLLSLLSKEIGIAFLGLVIAEEVLRLRTEEDRPAFVRAAVLGAMLVALGVYVVLRLAAIDTFSAPVNPQSNPLSDSTGLGERVWTASALLTRTFELMLFPAELTSDYSYAVIMPLSSPWDSKVLSGLALWLLLPIAALVFRKRAKTVSIGLMVFLAAYVPISNMLILVPAIFAERLLYLPSLGLLIAATVPLARLWASNAKRRRLLLAVFALFLVGNTIRSTVRAYDWRSQRAIFEAATTTAPLCSRSWLNLAVATLDENPEESLGHLDKSLEIIPQQPIVYSYKGVALDKLDRPKEAHVEMYRATRMSSNCRICAMNLVNLYIKYGFFEDARSETDRYRRASGDEPEALRLMNNIDLVEKRAAELGEDQRPSLRKKP